MESLALLITWASLIFEGFPLTSICDFGTGSEGKSSQSDTGDKKKPLSGVITLPYPLSLQIECMFV